MRTERLDPRTRPEPTEDERSETRDAGDLRKERETKDDGRYIIFYDSEDGDA